MTAILETLKQYYGYDSFRPGQEQLIDAILRGEDVLGVMPTGGGKSLCYQIPAICMNGVTIVISPLISLMKDQVDGLQTMGVKAAYINSQLTFNEQENILYSALQGELDLIYVSPERLQNEVFISYAQQMNINLVAVDEAHCVSQWGHDFRPSYQNIPQLMDVLNTRPPFAAFTATATTPVREDMVRQLNLNQPYQYISSFDRPNLYFSVVKPKKKANELLRMVDNKESSIIYCNTRKNVEKVYETLNKKGYPVTLYHAGISNQERTRNQEDFLYDRKPIMVATNAFGMGIDKSNVRRVIHYNMPLDMESYYQEAGRAGRDGAPSEAILFYSGQDIITNTFLIEQGNNPHAKANLNTMITYCKTGSCLRKTILNYFDEIPAWKECDHCSNCDSEMVKTDVTIECQKILSCVYRMNQAYGTGLVTDVLRGKATSRIKQMHFDELSTYGLMKEYTEGDIKDIISIMISEGYLHLGGDQYPILQFTPKTNDLLKATVRLSITKTLKEEPTNTKKSVENIENYDTGLFELLRELRRGIAQEMGKPPFVVFSDRSLIDMAAKFPATGGEFLDIHGVGEAKLEEYGEQFLEVIQTYTAEQSLDVEQLRKENLSVKEVVAKPASRTSNTSKKGATHEETLNYFKEGKTVAEIATIRGLSPTTIVNHLCILIQEGTELEYSKLVSEAVEAEIKAAVDEVGTSPLKPIKEVISESISYDEIKFVLAKLKAK